MKRQQHSVLLEIFGRIWALWSLLLFISTMLIAFFFYVFCFLLKEPYAARWHRSVSRVWMIIYLHAVGCPIRVSGKEHFTIGNNYVVVCNHNSLMDVPVTTPFMPQANKTIAKKEFARTPIFGWIYILGSVLVDRESAESRKRSYDRMKAVLRMGLDMVIYPEGTRNKSENLLGTFHDGAFRLARDCDKPVMPAVIFNTKKVLPATKFFFMLPHRLYMHFLPPVLSGNLSVTELKETVFQQMWDYYEKNESNL